MKKFKNIEDLPDSLKLALLNTLDDDLTRQFPAYRRSDLRSVKRGLEKEDAVRKKRAMKDAPSDKIAGRPLRINRQSIPIKDGKDYAEMIFLGDVHFGSPQCNVKKFLAMLDYCKEKEIPMLLMGDLLETATRDSIGAGVYEQEFPCQSQYERMVEFLLPVKNLILGLHKGNHEDRVYQATGWDIAKAMARELGVPYLGDACWTEVKVNGQVYTIYSLHGRTAAQHDGTVLTRLESIASCFHADIVAHAHAHRCVDGIKIVQELDRRSGTLRDAQKFLVVTGHYLDYAGSYWEKGGGNVSKLGSPKVKLMQDRHSVSISW